MDEKEVEHIKKKIIVGVAALTTRTFILQLITFISTFILTVLLSPAVFGVYFIVSAVISFLSYFSDIGLAAALIQKKEEPSQEELGSVFTLQQVLIGMLVLFLSATASSFGKFYSLDVDGIFLLRALLLSFFLSSLKTIPSVLLERKLEFSLLVIPQILETLTFYILAIVLALANLGIKSFAWAAIARGLVGVCALYIISPWKITICFSRKSLRGLLSFGVPFQLNSFLALVKDDLMTIFLGKILPFSQVGYIGWAKKWAEAPLRLIMDSIIRVTFPTYSRLAGDSRILGKALAKSFLYLAIFVFPVTIILVSVINPLIHIIPKYNKWEPALIPFYLFSFSSVLAAFSTPLINALNAIGKIKKTLLIMIIWTLLTWFFVPLFTLLFGFVGVSLAAFIISFTGVIPIFIIKKYISFNFVSSIYKPFITTFVLAVFLFPTAYFSRSILTLIFLIVTGAIFYGVIIWFWMRKEIIIKI